MDIFRLIVEENMEKNFKKQILNDFSLSEIDFESKDRFFVTNKADADFLFHNRYDFSLLISHGILFIRSENQKLIERLEKEYKTYPIAWFCEEKNMKNLRSILADFGIDIVNFFPIFTPGIDFVEKNDFDFSFIGKDSIKDYKNQTKMAFTFDDDDRFGLAFYDGGKLICLGGSSRLGKYVWEIGLEKFSDHPKYKGLASSMINKMGIIINKNGKGPVATTQFSHTRSINAISRAGFEMGTFIVGEKKDRIT